jgi:hypothetical protein
VAVRIQRVFFYAIAILVTALLAVGIAFFVVAQLIIGWLPDSTIATIAPDLEWPAHRLHDVAMASIELPLLMGVGLQLYRPRRRIALLLLAAVFAATFAAVQLAVGELMLPGGLAAVAIAVLLVLLHPAGPAAFLPRRVDRTMLAVVVVGGAPWLFFAIGQAALASASAPGDSHDAMEHWTRMTALGCLAIVYPMVASTDLPGWRLAGWLAATPPIVFGMQSLVFPDQASAATLPWGVLAVVYGLTLIGVTETRARKPNQRQV